MAKIRLNFPQISRIFNAEPLKRGLKLAVLAVLAAFLVINLFPALPADFLSYERARLAVMLYPEDLSSHLFLAQEYLKRGSLAGVERELLLAQELTEKNPPATSSGVLGAFLSPAKILEKIKNEPQKIKNEISFWEKIIAEKPDYRDAYLQLAILNYQIYENEKAQEFIKKALALDPNFAPTRELERLFGL